jgi:hypothetical protein
MRPDFSYVGWNPSEVRTGTSLYRKQGKPIELGFRAGGIRNCSYSSRRNWIALAAEDRAAGGHVVAVYDRADETTRVAVRESFVLHQALDPGGSRICYTRLSTMGRAADLCLARVDDARTEVLASEVVAHESIPSWLPDGAGILVRSSDGMIVVHDLDGSRTEIARGRSPNVRPDGQTVAFIGVDGRLILLRLESGERQELPLPPQVRGRLSTNLGWSPDGRFLTLGSVGGVTGKETRFLLLEVKTGKATKLDVSYCTGLVLMERTGSS